MKRSLTLLLLLFGCSALEPLHAGVKPYPAPGALTIMNGSGVLVSSHTEIETAAEAAGASDEHNGFRYDANYTAVGINTLFSGWRWESQYDISGSTAIGTQHGVVGFFEMNAARNNQYFSAAAEDSFKAFVSSTAPATAVPICNIAHGKVFNDLNVVQPFPAELYHPRLDFFNGNNENVAYSTHTFGYFIHPEFYRLNQANTFTVWGWYNPTEKSLQNVNAGNVFKVSISTQVDNGATLDLSQACGGRLLVTSTTSISFSTSKFANTIGTTPPSSSTLAVPYLADCNVEIVNNNIGNGRTLTVKDTADYVPITAGDEVIGANADEIQVWADGAAALWKESKAATTGASIVDAFNTSFGSITSGSTSTLTWTEVTDRNNEFVTSTFTVVSPGFYEINVQANASQTAGTGCLLIKKNNVTVTGANVCTTGATALATVLGIVDDRILSLAAGDTIYIAGSAASANVTFQNMTLTIQRKP